MNLTEALAHVAEHRANGTLDELDRTIRFIPDDARDARARQLLARMEPPRLTRLWSLHPHEIVAEANGAHNYATDLDAVIDVLRIWPGPADRNTDDPAGLEEA